MLGGWIQLLLCCTRTYFNNGVGVEPTLLEVHWKSPIDFQSRTSCVWNTQHKFFFTDAISDLLWWCHRCANLMPAKMPNRPRQVQFLTVKHRYLHILKRCFFLSVFAAILFNISCDNYFSQGAFCWCFVHFFTHWTLPGTFINLQHFSMLFLYSYFGDPLNTRHACLCKKLVASVGLPLLYGSHCDVTHRVWVLTRLNVSFHTAEETILSNVIWQLLSREQKTSFSCRKIVENLEERFGIFRNSWLTKWCWCIICLGLFSGLEQDWQVLINSELSAFCISLAQGKPHAAHRDAKIE